MAAPSTEIRANARAALAPVLLLNVIDLLALNKLCPVIGRLAQTGVQEQTSIREN
jgi:hypothetical protein